MVRKCKVTPKMIEVKKITKLIEDLADALVQIEIAAFVARKTIMDFRGLEDLDLPKSEEIYRG